MNEPKKNMIINLIKIIRPYLLEYMITLICVLLGTIVSLQYPLIIKVIVDDVLINKNSGMLFLMLAVYAGLFLLSFFFNFLSAFINELNIQTFAFSLRKRLFTHLQRTPLAAFNKTSMGEIMSNFNSDIDSICVFMSYHFLGIFTNIFSVIVVIVMLFLLNWKLAMMLIMTLPFFVLANLLTNNFFRKSFLKSRNLVTQGNELYHNVFSNIKIIKLFGAYRAFMKKFLHWQDDYITNMIKRVSAGNLLQQMVGVIFLVGNMVIIWFGAQLVFANNLTIGGLIAFYTYVPALFTPLRNLVASNVQIHSFETSLNRLTKYFDTEIEKPVRDLFRINKGKINFEDVSFSYNEKVVLKNISFPIESGEKVALIGRNGSGKTTLVNLLLKLYEVKSGSIRIDDIDTKRYSTDYLRKNIGLMTQEVNFFNLSIEENFKLYAPKCKERDIINACQLTGAHDFISQLPNGYKTVIGEKGNNFSGGQLQKMAIARLLLKDTKVIVFDEATSALDRKAPKHFTNSLVLILKTGLLFLLFMIFGV